MDLEIKQTFKSNGSTTFMRLSDETLPLARLSSTGPPTLQRHSSEDIESLLKKRLFNESSNNNKISLLIEALKRPNLENSSTCTTTAEISKSNSNKQTSGGGNMYGNSHSLMSSTGAGRTHVFCPKFIYKGQK